MTNTSTPLPVLLTPEEQDDLRRVLAHVERFDPGGFSATARHLLVVLDDDDRVGEHVYAYALAGPWGTLTEGDGSLSATIAGCRAARAAHWAEGYGRDERYTQIRVMRYAHTACDLGQFIGAGEVVEVPDFPLTPDEAKENKRRIAATGQARETVNAYLLDWIGSGSGLGDERQ